MNQLLTPVENPKLSLVVPMYNEERFLDDVIQRLVALDFDTEILLIDDGSTDSTAQIAAGWADRNENITLIKRAANGGKGAAVRDGFAASTGEVVVIQDSDLEYDPVNIPELVEPIINGFADVVYGSRLKGGQAQRAYMFWHLLGNKFLSFVTGALFNTTLSDMETGYKAFRGELIRSIELREKDFRIEPEMTAKLCKQPGIRIYEVPIAYYGRTYDEGKKITWRDGFLALGALVRYRFSD